MSARIPALLLLASTAAAGLHPAFPLLDSAGQAVLESGRPCSPVASCGACHDTRFIASDNPHAGLGVDLAWSGEAPADALPWERGDGPFGRWDPQRYDAPPAGTVADSAWARGALRHAGGGPALGLGLEHDCLLCHLASYDIGARREALVAGDFAWAASAGLSATGLLERTAEGWRWKPDAFEGREFPVERLPLVDPDDRRCGQCHGLVPATSDPLLLADRPAWRGDPAGMVWSGQRVSDSGLNLKGKDGLDRSWDVHAERLLGCTDCHASVNNPAHRREDAGSRPEHLLFDGRRAGVGEYLERPSHRLAGGSLSAAGDGATLDCRSCHDPAAGHAWLPYPERHLETVGCESCHIPDLPAGARQLLDWTALDADGAPLSAWHGAQGDPADPATWLEGVEPLLAGLRDGDGRTRLRPLLVDAVWLWVEGEPARPLRRETLAAVWARLGAEAPGLFDADGDGALSSVERRLDAPAKTAFVAERLVAAGADRPRVAGSLRPLELHHGTVRGEWALRDCAACHEAGGRVSRPLEIAPWLPGGAMPVVIHDGGALGGAGLRLAADGRLLLDPPPALDGRRLYVLGEGRAPLVDWIGLLMLAGVIGGVAVHGGLRWRGRGKETR